MRENCNKKRVLLSAYACAPNRGSEHGVGWEWALQVARFNKVWVITRSSNRISIEKIGNQEIRFIYVDLPDFMLFWKKGRYTTWCYYYIWQILAFCRAKKLNKEIKFDLVHHVTFMSVRPNFAPFLGIPSIVGPAGGLQLLPKGFHGTAGYPMKEWSREFLIRILSLSIFWNIFLHKATRLIIANSLSVDAIPRKFHHKIHLMQIGAVAPKDPQTEIDKSGLIKIYWGGIYERWKGLELLLRAIAKISNENLILDITGTGKDEIYYKQLVESLGIKEKVIFHGWLQRESQSVLIQECDIFVFTSLRETTGAILLEAMSLSKPVIVLNWSGPSEIVTNNSGIKIEVNSPEQVIQDLSVSIKKLSFDSGLRRKLGIAAAKRIKDHFSWDKIGEKMELNYDQILNSNEQ
jgi:glycosyltransferase involved in cell wall biosynthesis